MKKILLILSLVLFISCSITYIDRIIVQLDDNQTISIDAPKVYNVVVGDTIIIQRIYVHTDKDEMILSEESFFGFMIFTKSLDVVPHTFEIEGRTYTKLYQKGVVLNVY